MSPFPTPVHDERPVAERLRALILDQAGEAVLTCKFVPGGKFGGVGIQSYLYCANCSQGHLWHLVAEGLQLVATAEAIIQSAGERRPGESHASDR